jgi:hypothetical protein
MTAEQHEQVARAVKAGLSRRAAVHPDASGARRENMQSSSDSEDSEDERELLLSAELTVAYEGGSQHFAGAVAEYGAQSLSTAGTGIEIVAAQPPVRETEQFANEQEMQDKAVLVATISTEGEPIHKVVLDKARRAQAAGARVVLIAHAADDGERVFRPRKVPGEDGRGSDVTIPVLAVADPDRFRTLISQIAFDELVGRLRCTKPFERQMAKQHRRRATSFSSMTSLDTEPEPEPEPELSRTGSRSTVSWVDGYDHLNTAGELWSTTTRPEGKVAELHRRFPHAKSEHIQKALRDAQPQGDLEGASTILASRLSKTRSTLANEAEQMRDELERKGDKLERTASAHSREKELKQEAVSLLQDRKAVWQVEHDQLQAENERLQGENVRLRTERDSAEQRAADLTVQLDALNGNADGKAQQIAWEGRELEQRVQHLEATNAGLEDELDTYHDTEMTEIQELRLERDALTESNVVRGRRERCRAQAETVDFSTTKSGQSVRNS